jgi:predicted RNA polymerase sigma factor
LNRITEARRAYERAVEAAKDDSEKFYLHLCLDALERTPATPEGA